MAGDDAKSLVVCKFDEGVDDIGKGLGGEVHALLLDGLQIGPHLDEGEAATDGDVHPCDRPVSGVPCAQDQQMRGELELRGMPLRRVG
jgi:hypothetical protein